MHTRRCSTTHPPSVFVMCRRGLLCDLCAAVLCSVVRLPSSSSNIPRVGGHARLRESFVKLPRVRRHCDQEHGCACARVSRLSSQPGGSLRRHSSRWGRRMCAQSRPVCQVRLWPAALRHALPPPFLSADVERMPRVFPPADRVAVVTPRTCSRCRLILTGGEGPQIAPVCADLVRRFKSPACGQLTAINGALRSPFRRAPG